MATKFRTPWMGGGPQQASVAVTVYEPDGTTVATVYTDTAGTAGTNPVNTDANGVLTTFLNPGRYALIDSRGQRDDITVAQAGTDNSPPPSITGSRGTGLAAIVEEMLAAGAAKNLWVDNTTA